MINEIMEAKDPKAYYDEEAYLANELEYHVKLKKGDIARYVLLPGDPKRVGIIGGYLEKPRLVADYREYVTVNGLYKGIPVSIVSTGIGGPSATIAIEELIKVGADTFIRVGTGGGLSLKVNAGDIAIAQAAIKDEGTSREYIPLEYPAVADIELTIALRDAAQKLGLKYHVGVVHSKDCFYGELEPETAFFRERFENNLSWYTKAGAIVSEMEAAAIFSVCNLRRVRSSAVLYVVENTMMERMGTHVANPNKIEDMILTALEAIVILEQAAKDSTKK